MDFLSVAERLYEMKAEKSSRRKGKRSPIFSKGWAGLTGTERAKFVFEVKSVLLAMEKDGYVVAKTGEYVRLERRKNPMKFTRKTTGKLGVDR